MGNFYKLAATLEGHSLDVRAVAAPTAGLILSASRDKTVIGWERDVADSKFIAGSTYIGNRGFVNAVAYLTPTNENPEGLIVAAGADKLINIYNPAQPMEPIFSLEGHTGNVCSLDVTPAGEILSGSWDNTARLWKNWQCVLELRGHSQAVWGVLSMNASTGGGNMKSILTASADKSIRLWSNEKQVRSFLGHKDAVRGLALVPNVGFLSCSNDSTIRLWSLESGQCLQEMHGHTSFVYSIAVIPGSQLEFVSGGEDRSVRIWRDGEIIQTLTQPCISVWSVAAAPNGDIVVGGSDAAVRIFSRNEERWVDVETLRAFDEIVAAQAIPSNQVGDLHTEKLPGPDALERQGKKEGEVLMVRNGEVVEAHQWSTSTQTWVKIGDVVDAVGSSQKQTYGGRKYDHVFEVDIREGSPPLKLPFNVTENPYEAAQSFLNRNNISLEFIDQVANFIIKNASAVNLGTATGYTDPFTGSNRYTPLNSGAGESAGGYADPFTGGGRYVPGGAFETPRGNVGANPSAGEATRKPVNTTRILPQRTFLTFKQANVPAIRKKITDINSSTPPPPLVDLSALILLVQNLSTPTETSISSMQVRPLVDLITSWPLESRFPGLDLLRLVALQGVKLEGHEWPSFIETYAFEGVVGSEGALKKEEETNTMLGLRCLANLFESQAGREAVMRRSSETIAIVADFWKRMSNKNAKLALVTLLLNFSVMISKEPRGEDAFKLVGTLVEYLKMESDPETIYRALVATGTLILTLPNAKETAVIQEAKRVITGLKNKPSTEKRSADVANEIVTLL